MPPADPPRLSIDLVSPLPPVRSGIADYCVDLLPSLSERCDVRLVRLPGPEIAPRVASRFTVVESTRLAESGRLPLYQMGNNLHHDGVLELALREPGVVTLHDLVLHHLLLERTLGRGRLEPYRRALREDHGWIGEAVARPPRWGGYGRMDPFALPAHRSLVRSQRGVLVHSEWAEGVLREECGVSRVRTVPMAVPLPPLPSAGAAIAFRRRHAIPPQAAVLGSFGFQTPIKRTEVAVRALAKAELREVHLLVGGELSPAVDYEGLARELGVRERVHITGFLEAGDLPDAIRASDLCVNLRYPTAGETSASLLRILALGRPALVSDFAQFADLGSEMVVKVPLGDGGHGGVGEVESVARTCGELLRHPGRCREMGEAARDHVARHHDPARSATLLVEACEEWRGCEPPGRDEARVPCPTSLTWGRLAGRLRVEGAGLPWPGGERRTLSVRLENRGFARWLAGERPEGGIVLETRLLVEGRDLLAGRPWLPLPVDLEPGRGHTFEIPVRRPPGPSTLRIEPHVLGGFGFSALGGPVWETRLH